MDSVQNEFSSSLNELSKVWADTKPASQDTVADGIYQFCVISAELTSVTDKESNTKVPASIMKFKCRTPGKEEGKVVTSWDRLHKAQSVGFFKEKLRRLELEIPENISDLELVLKDAVGRLVTAKISNKSGSKGDMIFTNIYIQRFDGVDETLQG